MTFKKNASVTGFSVGLTSATDGSDITTGTPVGYYTLDGGTQTAIGDVTPVHEGNGQWSFDLTAAEMNGDIVGLTFTHASAITVHFTIKTDTKIVSELNDFNSATDTVATVTTLTNLPAITTNWLTAAGIAASAMNGKGDWNIGKTGYSLTQAFPTNFADMAITVTTGKVTIGTNDDKTGYSISGAITTLDGLENVAATDIVSAGAITTLTGAVVNVDLVDTTTTNTDMRGTDSAALASVATEARLSELDAVTAGKMANQVDIIQTDTTTDIPASIAALNDVAATDIVSGGAITTSSGAVSTVTTVGTTTTNTDMRGTDSAALASVATEARLSELDAGTGGKMANQVDLIKTDTDGIDDLAINKNAAFSNFEFLMVATSDGRTPVLGLTVTGQRSIDGAAFANVSGVIAEVSNGIYQFDALAADTNGDVITWRFSSATADDTFITFKTVA